MIGRRQTLIVTFASAVVALALGMVQASAAEFQVPPIDVPDGYVVELVAAPPLVEHPMMAGFDERGRLFVADSAGHNLNAEQLLTELPNRVLMLEDTDGDGRFDHRTVFADRMTFPMGALWHKGALYVASPPSIWRFEDVDGDGVAEHREELVSKFGFIGNAADVHGCFLGRDGRIYWCDGRHGHEFVDSAGRQISKGKAARIFSCRPDGSDLEIFCGGGMDNPVEVAFTSTGEMLGTMTFYNPDDARHDALVHFIWGGVYPRKHAVIEEFKRTGELMPALSRFDVVAPAGLAYLESDRLGPDFAGNALSAHFNTHRVVRHELQRDGATFRSRDSDFLVSPSPDFHPTDVLEDADGSLLVIDTGGWFLNGCPTSQLAKPEIRGAIYRVRRADAPPIDDPRGLRLAWNTASSSELTERLSDDRHAVQQRAIIELAKRADAVPALAEVLTSGSVPARRNAIWALCRSQSEDAMPTLRVALDDSDMTVRLAALHGISRRRDRGALSKLTDLLRAEEPPIRREAATALGRIGDSSAVPALLSSLKDANDRFVEHAIIYALIEINDTRQTAAGLADVNPQVRRGALIALDQMDDSNLTAEIVAPLLDTDDVALRQTALDVMTRHEGWADSTKSRLATWLDQPPAGPEAVAMVRGALIAFAENDAVAALMGEKLARVETPVEMRLAVLESIRRAPRAQPQASWQQGLWLSLADDDPGVRRAAVDVLAVTGSDRCDERLMELVADSGQPISLRVAAITVLGRGGHEISFDAFNLLIAQLDTDVAPLDRLAAAEALGSVKLSESQLRQLVEIVARAGPIELPALLAAFAAADDESLGRRLIAALRESPGLANIRAAQLASILEGYPATVRSAGAELLKANAPASDEVQARLAALKDLTHGGDAERGREIFQSKKTACAACHRVGDEGGVIGPELSTIGRIRTPSDLLESIAFPSLSLARGYESFSLATTSGHVYTGVIRRETSDAVFLQTAERSEIAVRRDEIQELVPASISVMPQGLADAMSPDDLRDLIAYLSTLK